MADSLALTESCPVMKLCLLVLNAVIELHIFNKEKKKNIDKMGKSFFVIILARSGMLVKDIAHSFF